MPAVDFCNKIRAVIKKKKAQIHCNINKKNKKWKNCRKRERKDSNLKRKVNDDTLIDVYFNPRDKSCPLLDEKKKMERNSIKIR